MSILIAFLLIIIWILAAISYSCFKVLSNIWVRGKLEMNLIEKIIVAPVTLFQQLMKRR